MFFVEFFHRLQFNHKFIFNKQVQAMRTDTLVFVAQFNFFLGSNNMPCSSNSMDNSTLIYLFKKSRSQLFMNLNHTSNHPINQLSIPSSPFPFSPFPFFPFTPLSYTDVVICQRN